MDKSEKQKADELEEQAEYIRKYNEEHKNRFSLFKFIKKIISKLKGRD